jgi:hypothetical protein
MELRLLAAALRRRMLVVALAALVGASLAAVLLTTQAGTYRATASLLLDPLAVTTPLGQPFTGDPERFVGGQMRVLQGQELAARAARLVPGEDADSLRQSVRVSHIVGSDVVDVTAEAREPRTAQALANAVVQAYVEQRQAETAAQIEAVVEEVDQQVAEVEQALAALPPETGTESVPNQQRQILLAQYQQLLDRQRSVTAPDAVRDSTRPLDLAPVPREPERLPAAATLAAGAALGALVMLAVSVVAEALRPRVTHRRQLESLLATPVLAAFGKPGRRPGRPEQQVKRLLPVARTVTSLIALSPHEGKRRLVGVCGASARTDGSGPALALAVAFAGQGSNVVLVQCAPDGLESQRRKGERPTSRPPAGPDGGWLGHGDGNGETFLRSTDWVDVHRACWAGARPARLEDVAELVEALPPVHDVLVLDLPPVIDSPLAASLTPLTQDVVLLVGLPDELERDVELAHGMLTGGRPDLRLLVVPRRLS